MAYLKFSSAKEAPNTSERDWLSDLTLSIRHHVEVEVAQVAFARTKQIAEMFAGEKYPFSNIYIHEHCTIDRINCSERPLHNVLLIRRTLYIRYMLMIRHVVYLLMMHGT